MQCSSIRQAALIAVIAAAACRSDEMGSGAEGDTDSGSSAAGTGTTDADVTGTATSAGTMTGGSGTQGAGECETSPWARGEDGPFVVSRDEAGTPLQAVGRPRLSADGRFLLFTSMYTPTASLTMYLADNACETIEALEIEGFEEGELGTGLDDLELSADGSTVVFNVRGPESGQLRGFAYDVATRTLERVDLLPNGEPGIGLPDAMAVSGDGRYVAFVSDMPLTDDDDDEERDDIYLRDRETGEVIFVSEGITESLGDVVMVDPWVSDDGQRVLYAVGKNDGSGIFVYLTDRTLGRSIEVGPGHPSLQVTGMRISADGQWMVEFVGYPEPFDPPLEPGQAVFAMRRVDTLFE